MKIVQLLWKIVKWFNQFMTSCGISQLIFLRRKAKYINKMYSDQIDIFVIRKLSTIFDNYFSYVLADTPIPASKLTFEPLTVESSAFLQAPNDSLKFLFLGSLHQDFVNPLCDWKSSTPRSLPDQGIELRTLVIESSSSWKIIFH